MITQANAYLEAVGYTDHGPRHVGYVSRITSEMLHALEYPRRTVELAAIAGWAGTYDVYPGHGSATTLSHEQTNNPYLRPPFRL